MLNVLLLLHLVGFALLASGTVLGSVAMRGGRGTTSVAEHRAWAALLSRAGPLAGLGALTLLLSGTALVWYMGLSFTTPWIAGTYATWIVAFATARFLAHPHAAAVGTAIAAMADRTDSDELRALYATNTLGARIQEVAFAVALLLMVFKPGA
jgi:hypothetical protein